MVRREELLRQKRYLDTLSFIKESTPSIKPSNENKKKLTGLLKKLSSYQKEELLKESLNLALELSSQENIEKMYAFKSCFNIYTREIKTIEMKKYQELFENRYLSPQESRAYLSSDGGLQIPLNSPDF